MNVVPSQNMPFQRLKVATLPLDLTSSGFVTHSGEVLTTAKSYKFKPDWLFPKDGSKMKNVLGFKCMTWNVR